MKSSYYKAAAFLLNLSMPGLGHVFFREYLFGVFVFLVMLIAAILFFVSIFLSLSFWPKAILLVLPVLFYLFTFIDLNRAVNQKRNTAKITVRVFLIFLAIGFSYQLLAPIAPTNFVIRNFPQTFVIEGNSLSPLHTNGSVLKASRLAYSVNIFFVKKPILHTLPARFDLVRFKDKDGKYLNGIVIGQPGEQVQMVGGVLVVNDLPIIGEPRGGLMLMGDCPLTSVDSYSILVATLHLGTLDIAYMVALSDVVGKIDKVF